MQFTFRALNRQDIKAISSWRYEGLYSQYNGEKLKWDMWLSLFLRAISKNPGYEYFAGENEQGELVGLFQFIKRPPHMITVGLGMRPDMTGQGLGLAFVEAGLAFARPRYAPTAFRLNVLSANQRAMKVYLRAGFKTVREFTKLTFHGAKTFYEMRRDEA